MLCIFRNTIKTQLGGGARLFQSSVPLAASVDRRKDFSRVPKDDEGVQGENVLNLDSMVKLKQNIFPTATSDDLLFDGVPYKNLPICNIRVSPNNTIINLTDSMGKTKVLRSCGMDGFKNTKKGTNIAAQTTAVAIAGKAVEKGYKTVRVRVQGLGPGRLAAVKGLQMGGLNIVSVTDNTHVSWNPPRPRKARRL